MCLPDIVFKRLERELQRGRARQRADKKAAARRMRSIMGSHLASTSSTDEMEGVKETYIINPVLEEIPGEFNLPGIQSAILNASRVRKYKGRKAKNSSFSPPKSLHRSMTVGSSPASPVAPAPPPQTPAPVDAAYLERKIARLEAELQTKDRGRQKRTNAFNSLKASEHLLMLDLMDARLHIEGLEAKLARSEEELEENQKETVSWVQRAEKFKAERYQAFSHTIDSVPPPPSRGIEWGTLVRQPKFWAGAVGMAALLTAVYATGKYSGGGAPAVSFLPCFKSLDYPIFQKSRLY